MEGDSMCKRNWISVLEGGEGCSLQKGGGVVKRRDVGKMLREYYTTLQTFLIPSALLEGVFEVDDVCFCNGEKKMMVVRSLAFFRIWRTNASQSWCIRKSKKHSRLKKKKTENPVCSWHTTIRKAHLSYPVTKLIFL